MQAGEVDGMLGELRRAVNLTFQQVKHNRYVALLETASGAWLLAYERHAGASSLQASRPPQLQPAAPAPLCCYRRSRGYGAIYTSVEVELPGGALRCSSSLAHGRQPLRAGVALLLFEIVRLQMEHTWQGYRELLQVGEDGVAAIDALEGPMEAAHLAIHAMLK
jgi:hypothetical protein